MEITPIEYVEGDYHNRKDVVVWHGDNLVWNVYWEQGRKSYRVAYVNDDDRSRSVRKYGHSLKVEKIDYQSFRQQIHALVDKITEDELLYWLEELRTCV